MIRRFDFVDPFRTLRDFGPARRDAGLKQGSGMPGEISRRL
jgi:hypothetical protein